MLPSAVMDPSPIEAVLLQEPIAQERSVDLPAQPLWEGITRLARVADRGTVLETILTLMETIGLAGPHILLHDHKTGTLDLVAHRGVPWQLASLMVEPSGELAPYLAWEEPQTRPNGVLGAMRSVPLPCGLSHQAVALYGDNRLLGVLGWLRGPSEAGPPRSLEDMAGLFSAALQRILRGARQRKRSSQRDAVRRAALVVGEARDLPSMLRAICDRAKLLSGAGAVAVQHCGLPLERGPCAMSGPFGTDPASAETWPHQIPIRYQGRQLAIIYLRPDEEAERPTEDDLQIVALLSGHVAALLEAATAKSQLLLEVSERRRTESWLSTVLEHSPVATLLLSQTETGPIASGNRRAKDLLGPEVEGALPRILPLLQDAKGVPFSQEANPLSRALGGERIVMLEAQVCSPEGEPVPVMIHGEPIGREGEPSMGAVIALENISTFKALERMREQWTSLVTHDLRQPITSILGFSSLLMQQRDIPESAKGKLVHIRSAAKRLARISSDLLDASKMDAKELALEKSWVDVASLVRGLVEEMSREGSGQAIVPVLTDGIPLVEIDPIRLEQVLENLLSNARKYGRGEAPIYLRAEPGQGELLLHVENEGDGLDPEEVSRIFTRFFRGNRATKSDKPGMGLGLYISKALIEAHGGRLWVTSIKGKSVVFSISLPVTR